MKYLNLVRATMWRVWDLILNIGCFYKFKMCRKQAVDFIVKWCILTCSQYPCLKDSWDVEVQQAPVYVLKSLAEAQHRKNVKSQLIHRG